MFVSLNMPQEAGIHKTDDAPSGTIADGTHAGTATGSQHVATISPFP